MLEKMFEKAQKKVDNGMLDRVALCPKNVISSFFGLSRTSLPFRDIYSSLHCKVAPPH